MNATFFLLPLAAVLMLMEQPLLLRHSGFLLSFGAVAGIGLVLPWWKEMAEALSGYGGLTGSKKRRGEERRKGAGKRKEGSGENRNTETENGKKEKGDKYKGNLYISKISIFKVTI